MAVKTPGDVRDKDEVVPSEQIAIGATRPAQQIIVMFQDLCGSERTLAAPGEQEGRPHPRRQNHQRGVLIPERPKKPRWRGRRPKAIDVRNPVEHELLFDVAIDVKFTR